jgi:hypothetical protein
MLKTPRGNKITEATKHLVFFASLAMIIVVLIFLIRDEAKIPQREIVLKLDLSNRVNVCEPEEPMPDRSFFDF